MNLTDFGTLVSPADAGNSLRGRAPASRKAYDALAGSALLRRSGKAGVAGSPLRGDATSTLLGARRKVEPEDRLDRRLAEYYQAVLNEPVPERLVALVEALESGQAG